MLGHSEVASWLDVANGPPIKKAACTVSIVYPLRVQIGVGTS